ncbi:14863_t:CDS:2, partial [Racocetra persica]
KSIPPFNKSTVSNYKRKAMPISFEDYASNLIKIPEKLRLSWLTYWVIKRTFFVQFCGGETDEECIDTMSKLRKYHIGSILGPSIETDLNQDESSSDIENDEKFNQATNIYLSGIKTMSKLPNSFVNVKITGLSDPLILKNLTLTLNSLNKAFDQFDNDQDGTLRKTELKNLFVNIFGESESRLIDRVLNKADSDNKLIDRLDYFKILLDNRDFMIKHSMLNQKMIKGFNQLLTRLEQISKTAHQYNVKLLIDAEQSYFQPGIDYLAMGLSLKFNKLTDENNFQNGPIIFNTYQMYLKDSSSRLKRDYELSRRNKFVFAAKLVRGAYMANERLIAKESGYPDPIHDNLEDTHESYNGAVTFLLNELYKSKKNLEAKNVNDGSIYDSNISNNPLVFVIASHNQESIIKACEKLDQLGINLDSGAVYFAQLYGMCDQITYALSGLGYPVYKALIYGKVNEVIPYLIRRAQENSSVLDGRAAVEQKALWNEIIRRFKFCK